MASLALNPDAILARDEDGYSIYQTADRRLHRLNPTAALIVELCDGSRDLDAVERIVRPTLGPEGDGAVRAWIESALADGLLSDSEGTASPSADRLAALAADLRDEGRVLEAFLCQRRAVELAPDAPEIFSKLGELAHILGRREEARAAYEAYLALEPGDAEVEHILVSLRGDTPPDRAPDRCITQLYARFASFYDQSMCGDLDYQAPDRLAEALVTHLPDRAGLAVLDLGCGTGLSGAKLRDRAASLVGIDLSREMVEQARGGGLYDRLDTAEITAWLEENRDLRFDLIVACDSLIYFGDLGQVLRPARTILKPGGLVVITVEKGDTVPYRLTDSGRYAHHPDYVRAAGIAAGLEPLAIEEAFLRYEYGHEVVGLVAVFWNPAPAVEI